jgi:beta-N-acetylhexosaminidase
MASGRTCALAPAAALAIVLATGGTASAAVSGPDAHASVAPASGTTASGLTASTSPTADPTASATAEPEPESAPGSDRTWTRLDDPVRAELQDRLAAMSTRDKVEGVLMLWTPGADPAAIAGFTQAYRPAGLIVMGGNVPDPATGLGAVTAAADVAGQPPTLVGIDQEGGTVRRVRSDTLPAGSALAAAPPATAYDAFAQRAALLDGLGVDVNFGVVADVTADPASFIRPRVLGGDAAQAAERVAAAVQGERGVVLTTLKHFPGHGAVAGDSHTSIPETAMGYDEWRATTAPPFEAGIDAGAELVMTGHLRYSAVDPLPASLSPRWHEILRDDLGFRGVVVTDDLKMLQDSGLPEYADPVQNATAALAAGNDLLLTVGGVEPGVLIDGLTAAVDEGRVPAERLDDAARAVLRLRLESAG